MKNNKAKHRRHDDHVLLMRVYVRSIANYVGDSCPVKETMALSVAARVAERIEKKKISGLIELALKKTRPVNRSSLRKDKIRLVAANLLKKEGKKA